MNGLGLTVPEAEAELQRLETLFPALPDVPEIYPEWKRLILEYGVMGVNVHDARLDFCSSDSNHFWGL